MKYISPLTLIIILFLFSANAILAQDYFAPVGDFTSAMNINLLEAKVDGINFIAGDEIGIYDDDICVGSVVLIGDLGELIDTKNKGASAGGDDTETVIQDGFVVGNPISFRIWDASENIEFTVVNATYIDPRTGDSLIAPTFDVGATAFVSLSVNSNKKPTANAGNDKIIDEKKNGVIDGSASSDPEGQQLSFFWTDIDNIGLNVLTGSKPKFTAPNVLKDADFRIALTVNDGVNNSDPDTVVISVKNINEQPVARAGNDFVINEGENVVLDGSASVDPDGDEISYQWDSDFIMLDDISLSSPVFTAPEVQKDTIVLVTLIVTDGKLVSLADTVRVTIRQVNKIPVIKAGNAIVVSEGEEIRLDGSGTFDPDGDLLVYNWGINGIIEADTSVMVLTFTAPEVEQNLTIPVLFSVSDGFSTIFDTTSITILQVNKSPFWIETPTDSAFVGYGYSAAITVSDPDLLDTISVFADNLPDWLSLTDYGDGTALLKSDSVPRETSLIGNYSVTLKASDGIEVIESDFELNVSVKTGLKAFEAGEVAVYPNPSFGLLNISCDKLPEKYTTIQIVNQTGQVILEDKLLNQFQMLDISGHPAGLYFVKINTPNFGFTKKIILN